MGETSKHIIKLMADFSTVGMTIGFCIFIGVGAGYYLDHKVFNSEYAPWLTGIGLGLGIAAAFKNLYALATRKDWDDNGSKNH